MENQVNQSSGQPSGSNLNAEFNFITGWFKKIVVIAFWTIFCSSLLANGIQLYLHVLSARAIREANLRDKQHAAEADAARADAKLARTQKENATIVYQTNLVFVAQSESNVARIQSDYSGASNSLDAWSLYKRRHSIPADPK